jgi:hypothetical protein
MYSFLRGYSSRSCIYLSYFIFILLYRQFLIFAYNIIAVQNRQSFPFIIIKLMEVCSRNYQNYLVCLATAFTHNCLTRISD